MYNYVKRGFDNGSEKEDNANSQPASQPAKHNSALFLVKSKIAYFFKAYSARFRTGGVRLFVLVD
jgi:hypothetical protein